MTPIYTPFFFFGALLGGIAFAAGAFGAHSLKTRLTPELLITFETGVRYQIMHALLLLILALVIGLHPMTGLKVAGYLILIGTTIFSGSLYILCLSGVRQWGAVTPLGGILMLIGWIWIIVSQLIAWRTS